MAKQRINLPLLVKAATVIPTVKLVLESPHALGSKMFFIALIPSDVNRVHVLWCPIRQV